MKTLAILALALLPAQTSPAPNSTLWSSASPPPRYHGNAVVVTGYVSPAMIGELCGKAPPGMVMMACSGNDKDGNPLIIIPNPCLFDDQSFARLLCHEKGHILGWPATHGD